MTMLLLVAQLSIQDMPIASLSFWLSLNLYDNFTAFLKQILLVELLTSSGDEQ